MTAIASQCGRAPDNAAGRRLSGCHGCTIAVTVQGGTGPGPCGVVGGRSGDYAVLVDEDILESAGAVRVTLVAFVTGKAVVGPCSGMLHVR